MERSDLASQHVAHAGEMSNREDLNLGWLAGRQSGVPQKIKAIEGVSRTSALDLKAQTEKVKGLAQSIRDGSVEPGERRKRGIDLASLGPSNSGVREREERDRLLHVKEVSNAEDWSSWGLLPGPGDDGL